MTFPKDFLWGAAAASYQIEGAYQADGRGLSVWDVFSHTPGKTWNGHTGDVACDHYHRCAEDVALMQQIGLQAYRFSIAWPRVLPEGTGRGNEAGLAFYDRLVDTLLAANIQPYATLYHWDLPYELYLRGGWSNRQIGEWFAEYAELVGRRLGDRLKHWMTFNEPGVFVTAGHQNGGHAPGEKRVSYDLVRMVQNVQRAHGLAVQALRAVVPGAQVGIVMDAGRGVSVPYTETAADIAAARQHFFAAPPDDFGSPAAWVDPLVHGKYPEDALRLWEAALPATWQTDLATMQQPLDFLGLNIYFGQYVRAGTDGQPELVPFSTDHPRTMFYWPVMPEALDWGTRFFHERYKLPIYITENGLASMDWVGVDGAVHDPNRIDFLTRYLRGLRRASEAGADVRGYFQWSILDNYEWAEGYKLRFGLVYVNFDTQERILKDSARWYSEVIRSNGANL